MLVMSFANPLMCINGRSRGGHWRNNLHPLGSAVCVCTGLIVRCFTLIALHNDDAMTMHCLLEYNVLKLPRLHLRPYRDIQAGLWTPGCEDLSLLPWGAPSISIMHVFIFMTSPHKILRVLQWQIDGRKGVTHSACHYV